MKEIELPCPHEYAALADYCRAVKPVIAHWRWLHRESQWKSPAEEWRWCKQLEDEHPDLRAWAEQTRNA